MLKNIIAPVQAWLLSQQRCVGCGTPLSQGLKQDGKKVEIIKCKCKRMYVYNATNKSFRRALFTEI